MGNLFSAYTADLEAGAEDGLYSFVIRGDALKKCSKKKKNVGLNLVQHRNWTSQVML